jgi:hypothetical protein
LCSPDTDTDTSGFGAGAVGVHRAPGTGHAERRGKKNRPLARVVRGAVAIDPAPPENTEIAHKKKVLTENKPT